MAFTNAPITAQQALSWGLINRVVPPEPLQTSVYEMAIAIASGPIYAMGLTKRDFNKAIYPNMEQVLDYEAHIQVIARLGAEHKEGVNAFVEKRTPNGDDTIPFARISLLWQGRKTTLPHQSLQ